MKYYNKKDIVKIQVIIFLAGIPILWALVNADGFIIPAFMYLIMGAFSIWGYNNFNKIGAKSYIFGIDNNMGKDFLIGLAFGVGFILLQTFNIIGSVLIPYVPASFGITDFGRISIIVIGAMIMESAFFLGLLVPFFDEKLKSFGINPPFLVALLIVCVIFPIFHASAYQQVGANFGSYISAGIFLFFSGLIMRQTKSLLPLIISHGIVNFWILNQQFNYITLGLIG